MEGEQFSLCWNNFHSNLSAGFHSLLKDEDLVDVTLAAEGKFLKAHKTVLSVCSPFFKELFRVNPCKHPIVILPDVNYGALCSLLHFMYQGEVSVSQEEIPTFMRVAETLKVKGLTDNSSSSPSDTNGFTNASRGSYSFPDPRQIMKRPRPVKKIIRPIQHLRPIESPKLVKSPQPQTNQPMSQQPQQPQQPQQVQQPPAKKPHVETESPQIPATTVTQTKMEFQEPFIKPKEEPVDPLEEENASQSDDMDDDSNILRQCCIHISADFPAEVVRPFTEQTFKKCQVSLATRIKFKLSYTDIDLPKSFETVGYGYHTTCYRKFTALRKSQTQQIIDEEFSFTNSSLKCENLDSTPEHLYIGAEEPHLDISHMLDTTLGEPSPSQPFPNWPTPDFPKSLPQDTSSPGTLQCILGRRGNPRLIVDGYVFYKKSVYKGKAFWYCKNSRTPEKCQAVCWTMNGNIVKWPYMHTHPVIPDVFNPDEDTEVPIENLQEVLWQTSLS